MTLEAYLTLIGRVMTGAIWTALCLMITTVVCVYGYKTVLSLVRNADNNIAKFRRARILRRRPLKVVERAGDRRQKI